MLKRHAKRTTSSGWPPSTNLSPESGGASLQIAIESNRTGKSRTTDTTISKRARPHAQRYRTSREQLVPHSNMQRSCGIESQCSLLSHRPSLPRENFTYQTPNVVPPAERFDVSDCWEGNRQSAVSNSIFINSYSYIVGIPDIAYISELVMFCGPWIVAMTHSPVSQKTGASRLCQNSLLHSGDTPGHDGPIDQVPSECDNSKWRS
ncbi:hypothetical protein FN846DRAFT_491291 [Sphaerosporella brunnea]|uniref:Uncharacterized protein n=1 Tax=Sphaerosporella brunnea TaxID=1250544 RepID=A0A5J5EFH1_9PEZI|nr:hypothetical protein FN846DRAFT_491291 [Sphaerosporella brunnea]